jgi:ectoine hydroxylase-related dioxygenase (phytanoyl-CoA dioxygenase family)
MNTSAKAYGVVSQNTLQSDDDLHLEELSIHGFSVVHGVLSQNELAETRKRLDAVYAVQEAELSGSVALDAINEKNLARIPLAYDDFFIRLAAHAKMTGLVKRVLGNYFVLHLQNGIINMPNEEHHQSSWHRDLPYQEFTSSRPLAVNALYCIDDFSEESGGTWVLPVSHRVEKIPSQQFVDKHAVAVTAPAGSVILMDAMVFHKAGYNRAHFVRRAINHVYTAGILKQQIDLPAALNGKGQDDAFLSMLLGYQAAPPQSVKAFRLQRAAKMKT